MFHWFQVNIGLALAILRGLAKDDVRTGAWEQKKVGNAKVGMGMVMVFWWSGSLTFLSVEELVYCSDDEGGGCSDGNDDYDLGNENECEAQEIQVKNLFLDLGESLVGKTCGFLGLGKIGLATARRQSKKHEK